MNNGSDLVQNILEAANFVKYFTASPATLSTPHLYISALATWSNHIFISQTWTKKKSFHPFSHSYQGQYVNTIDGHIDLAS